MKKYKRMEMSEFYCTKCGSKNISLARPAGQQRPVGHLKVMYCWKCKSEHNMVEVRPYTKYDYEDFLVEMENNNFDENGDRKMEYYELKQKLNDEKLERMKKEREEMLRYGA